MWSFVQNNLIAGEILARLLSSGTVFLLFLTCMLISLSQKYLQNNIYGEKKKQVQNKRLHCLDGVQMVN